MWSQTRKKRRMCQGALLLWWSAACCALSSPKVMVGFGFNASFGIACCEFIEWESATRRHDLHCTCACIQTITSVTFCIVENYNPQNDNRHYLTTALPQEKFIHLRLQMAHMLNMTQSSLVAVRARKTGNQWTSRQRAQKKQQTQQCMRATAAVA